MLLIAEIAQAHEGSLGIAHSYIDALAKTGVDAVKFQVHIAEAESSIYEPFRINFSKQENSRYDYWKRMEFSTEQWRELKTHCDKVNIEFMASPFSNTAVDLLEELDVKRYKIGSGEVNNFLLLEKIARTGKPIILSSGLSSFEELDDTVKFLKNKNIEFSILQCTTSYPTVPENYGLNVIKEMKKRYEVPIGYSDHSAKLETGIAAITLGAEILEFHAVFNREMFGPDASSSLELNEIKQLVSSIRNLENALQHKVDKDDNSSLLDLKEIFEKSLAVNKDLPLGHIITFEDLESKKPRGYGIPAFQFQQVIGKSIKSELKKWDFLKEDHIH
ncbi:N-acetylneuraminate synthase family protein [Christiangramia sediminis]|uniref:N-acetylneuraminate synthase family protein n=1 Tax=Christiangramia sediminis TaxID=2881336 RepID=A0A9X1LJ72_9FLAO|nr:N-acetylneuraminate synthase family protein [Christiangramia sediminis]MCB7481337.1 N-acetylneuraminate synthase family protein [Christiangramia sediminis]